MSQVEDAFRKAAVPYRVKGANTGRNHVNICCPFCQEDRFHLGVQKDEFWFRCFVCDETGPWNKLRDALKKYYPSLPYLKRQSSKYEVKVEEKQSDFAYMLRHFTERDAKPYEWLISKPNINKLSDPLRPRWISEDRVKQAETMVSVDDHYGYVGWREEEGVLMRRWCKDAIGPKWYKRNTGKMLFGEASVKKIQPEVIVIAEGVFDCLRFKEGSSIALLGSSISDKVLAKIVGLSDNLKLLHLVFDRDVDKKKTSSLKYRLEEMGYQVIVFDWSSIPSRVKDVDELCVIEGIMDLSQFVGIKTPENLEL